MPALAPTPVTSSMEPGRMAHLGAVLRMQPPSVVEVTSAVPTASGSVNEDLDAGVKILKGADRVQILGLTLYDNMHGIDVHGGRDAQVIGNRITGRQNLHMNARGNGIYVWNSPGTLLDSNEIRYGRDGIFSNASASSIYRNNIMRDLRFAAAPFFQIFIVLPLLRKCTACRG